MINNNNTWLWKIYAKRYQWYSAPTGGGHVFRMSTQKNKRSEKIWWRRWHLRWDGWTCGDVAEGCSRWREQREWRGKGKEMRDLCGQQFDRPGAWCRDSDSITETWLAWFLVTGLYFPGFLHKVTRWVPTVIDVYMSHLFTLMSSHEKCLFLSQHS